MDLKTFIKSATRAEREQLADACKTSVGHLRNIAYECEGKRCSVSLASDLERESRRLFGRHRVVTREDLIPDEWEKHWPELRSKQKQRMAMRGRCLTPALSAPSGDAAQQVAAA
jgi:hypothetical protein